jgi:intergrase/recombinase
LRDKNATKYVQKLPNVIAYKYLRKFAFDKMVELGVPESIADFIEGRTPKTIGAEHYMILLRQAKQYYPRYAEYITQLRRNAGLLTA